MKWGDGMAGCPAAGPSLRSQGQTKMPVRSCSSPYRAKSQGDLWQTSCHSPLPSQGTAAIMHRTGWQYIPKQTSCCPKYFRWLHLPWLNRSGDMRKHKACGASRPLKESYQTKLKQCVTRDLRREKVVFRSNTEHRFEAHVLATTVSSVTTDGKGTAPCLQSRSRDMHSVSTLKSREAGAQNWRLPWLHPAAALLRFT